MTWLLNRALLAHLCDSKLHRRIELHGDDYLIEF